MNKVNDIYTNNNVNLKMDDNIAIMTISNGKQNKLIDPEFLPLEDLKKWLKNNNPVGLIICGNGRNFSSGADVEEISRLKNRPEILKDHIKKGKKILDYIEKLPYITVAAISGMCCGGGLEVALSCQFRIATHTSVFSFPEAKLGLLPGLGGTVRLQNLVGRSKSIRMIITGEVYLAEEALQMGLVDKLVEKGESLDEAKKLILSICNGKMNKIINTINHKSYDYETDMFVQCVQQCEFHY